MKWIAAVMAVVVLTGGRAMAEEVEVGPHLETRIERPNMWVDGYVGDLLDTRWLRIVLRAPDGDGGREFWQRCDFEYSGEGRYSCGFRIGKGTDASRKAGEWAAKLVSEEGRLARILFDVPAR